MIRAYMKTQKREKRLFVAVCRRCVKPHLGPTKNRCQCSVKQADAVMISK
jgi:hypothetical protein